MKRIIYTLLFSAVCTSGAKAQLQATEINLIGGKTFSTFIFRNSESEKDETLQYTMNNSFGINLQLESGSHVLRPEIMFRQGGAKSDFAGTALSWKLNYLDLNFGYLYKVINSDRFEVSPGVAIGAGYLLNGEQYIGTTRYTIAETKSLNNFDLGAQGIANFKAKLSESMSLSLEYRFGAGLIQIENDVNPQKSRNIYQSALLGIGIRIN